MVAVLDRNAGQCGPFDAVFVQVALCIHRIPGNWHRTEHRLKIDIAGQPDAVVQVLQGGHCGLEMNPDRQHALSLSGSDLMHGEIEGMPTGHAVAQHLDHG